jgi:LPS export ABC transporter protein LptC
MKKAVVITTALLVLLVAPGCGDQQGSLSERAAADSSLIPDSEVTGARIYLYDKGSKTAEVLAERIVKYEKIDSTMAYALDIDVLDSTGNITSELTGDSGVIREATGEIDVFGEVELISRSGRRLETDFLHWDSKNNLLTTDTTHHVRVIEEQSIVRGRGLEADLNVDRYRILKDVTGEIADPDQISPR